MMKKSGIIALGMAGIFLMVMAFLPTEAVSKTKPIIIKYSEPSAFGSARTKAVVEWCKWIEEQTGNRLKIEIYWSGVLS